MLYGLRRHPERLDRYPGVRAELIALGFSWDVPKKGPKGPRRKKFSVDVSVLKPPTSTSAALNDDDETNTTSELWRRERVAGSGEKGVGEGMETGLLLNGHEVVAETSEAQTLGLDIDADLISHTGGTLGCRENGKGNNKPQPVFELSEMVGEGMTETMRVRLEQHLVARKQQHQRRLRKVVALGATSSEPEKSGELKGLEADGSGDSQGLGTGSSRELVRDGDCNGRSGGHTVGIDGEKRTWEEVSPFSPAKGHGSVAADEGERKKVSGRQTKRGTPAAA